MNKRGILLVLSGPSGVGKGTIGAELLKNHDDLCFSVSATTRAIRGGEVEGVNYFYKTEEEFNEMIANNEFLEYMCVFGKHRYGTPRAYVENKLAQGTSVLLDIDQLTLEIYPGHLRMLSIAEGLKPDETTEDEYRARRLRSRLASLS